MKYIDLDFFQPERDRRTIKRKKMIPLALLAFGLSLILLFVIYLQIAEAKLDKELADIVVESGQEEMEMIKLQAKNESIREEVARYESGIEQLDPFKASGGIPINDIHQEHLKVVLYSTPKEAFYERITMQDNVLTLVGYSETTQAIAKIGYNLEVSGYIENIRITNISAETEVGYYFTIVSDIKE